MKKQKLERPRTPRPDRAPPAPSKRRVELSWDDIRDRLLRGGLTDLERQAVESDSVCGTGGSTLVLDAGADRVVRVFVVGPEWTLGDRVMRPVSPACVEMGMAMTTVVESNRVRLSGGYVGLVTTERLYRLKDWVTGLRWKAQADSRSLFARSWTALRDRVRLGPPAPGTPFDGVHMNVLDLDHSTYKHNLMVRSTGQVVVADVFPPDDDEALVVYKDGCPVWTDAVWATHRINGQERGLERMDLLTEAVRGSGRMTLTVDDTHHTGSALEVALAILDLHAQFVRLRLD